MQSLKWGKCCPFEQGAVVSGWPDVPSGKRRPGIQVDNRSWVSAHPFSIVFLTFFSTASPLIHDVPKPWRPFLGLLRRLGSWLVSHWCMHMPRCAHIIHQSLLSPVLCMRGLHAPIPVWSRQHDAAYFLYLFGQSPLMWSCFEVLFGCVIKWEANKDMKRSFIHALVIKYPICEFHYNLDSTLIFQ